MLLCTIALFLIQSVQSGFPTTYLNAKADCWNKAGRANCITEDYKYSFCCDEWDKACMKNYKYCTYGLKEKNYMYLTHPSFGCPNNNDLGNMYHTKFNDYQQ